MQRAWKFGDHVDTDQIVPGRYAPYMRPNEDVGDAAFIEAHPQFNAEARPGDIIVAGTNFGCGSSREYAPLALKRREIGCVIAISFARIFFRNAVNLGIPIFIAPDLVSRISDGAAIQLDLETSQVTVDGEALPLPALPEFAKAIIAVGGIANYVREFGRLPAG